MTRFLNAALHAAASGRTVGIATPPDELTSVEAAKLVGVSRPTLLKMAKSGDIPSRRVGSHTRFLASDVTEFIRQRTDGRVASFNDFRDAEEALGIRD